MSDQIASSPPARQRRARLLIVGDDPTTLQLGDALPVAPARVGNLFEAIGALSSAEAMQLIAAVLIPEALLPPTPQRALEALKRVDPSARLIRVVGNGRSKDVPAIEGFDECLEAPIAGDTIQRILSETTAAAPAIEPVPVVAPAPEVPVIGSDLEESPFQAAPAPPSPPSPPRGEPQAKPEEAPPAVGEGKAIDEHPISAALRHRSRPAALPRRDPPPPPRVPTVPTTTVEDIAEELGDTDLIEAMMNRPEGVRDIALRLIRQQTGWRDIQLLDSSEAPPPEKAQVEVRHGEEAYGHLATGMAATKQLAPWAPWLGRWLALDAAYRDYRILAYRDDLTGAWNRRYFNRFLEQTIVEAAARRRPLTVMVFDIDDFKLYNDRYGHEAGDVILCETVDLLNSVIRECDRVCRIGGDEFAVIFADVEGPREIGSSHPESVEQIARRFQEQICTMRFPKLGPEARGTLSISAGLATYPWDGNEPARLLYLADRRALESKRKGKNHITYGPDAASLCRPEGD